MLLAVREREIKTKMRDHYIPIRMANTKNSDKAKCWWNWRKWITYTLLVEIENDIATLENSSAVP